MPESKCCEGSIEKIDKSLLEVLSVVVDLTPSGRMQQALADVHGASNQQPCGQTMAFDRINGEINVAVFIVDERPLGAAV